MKKVASNNEQGIILISFLGTAWGNKWCSLETTMSINMQFLQNMNRKGDINDNIWKYPVISFLCPLFLNVMTSYLSLLFFLLNNFSQNLFCTLIIFIFHLMVLFLKVHMFLFQQTEQNITPKFCILKHFIRNNIWLFYVRIATLDDYPQWTVVSLQLGLYCAFFPNTRLVCHTIPIAI